MLRRCLWILLLHSCGAMPSCRSDHETAASPEANCGACRAISQQVKRILVPSGTTKRPRYRTLRITRCVDCRCDVEFYEVDGHAHMRCETCAPGGVVRR